MGNLGVVIRKDGTVPFDDDVHPEVRAAVIAHLVDKGHVLVAVPNTKHLRIENYKAA